MSLPPFLRAHADGVYLAVKVQPRASKNEIGEPLGPELKVKVTAPPVESAANEALLRFLADQLNCPRGAVELVRGQTSRHKVVFIRGLTAALAQQKFGS
ncbi:MAG: YggU family protein [Chloroflexi bacterium]|nr:YggU family protein [Chloroflexota bacterium]